MNDCIRFTAKIGTLNIVKPHNQHKNRQFTAICSQYLKIYARLDSKLCFFDWTQKCKCSFRLKFYVQRTKFTALKAKTKCVLFEWRFDFNGAFHIHTYILGFVLVEEKPSNLKHTMDS